VLTKIVVIGVELKIVAWGKEFLLGRSQRVWLDGQLSDQDTVNSGVTQWSVICPLLFLAYVNDIGRNIKSNIRLFADNCVM
jgi:phosphodiesterase/alkaline phosphatase D-like protein